MSDRADDTPTYSEGARKRRERRRTSSVTQLARKDLVDAATKGDDERAAAMDAVLANWRLEIETRCREQVGAEVRSLRAQVASLTEEVAAKDRVIRELRGGR
jgi:hypothetical protein